MQFQAKRAENLAGSQAIAILRRELPIVARIPQELAAVVPSWSSLQGQIAQW